MIKIHSFTCNPFQENTYILTNQFHEAIIIDPGMYGENENHFIFSFIEKNELKPVKILNTHAHIDHILGVDAVKTKYNIPFLLHEKEKEVLKSGPNSAMLYGLKFKISPQVDKYLDETVKSINFGADEIQLLFTPGHSPGSLSFYIPSIKSLIAGDTLFNSSIGRTDLPGGDHETLLQSIREKLYSLPEDTMVFPGHGPVTQIGYEKTQNPFVKA